MTTVFARVTMVARAAICFSLASPYVAFFLFALKLQSCARVKSDQRNRNELTFPSYDVARKSHHAKDIAL